MPDWPADQSIPTPPEVLGGEAARDGSDHLYEWNAHNVVGWATTDTLRRLTPDTHPKRPLNYTIRHDACGLRGMELLDDPDHPPDPDRHGNRRVRYRCPHCDDRFTLTVARGARNLTPKDYTLVD